MGPIAAVTVLDLVETPHAKFASNLAGAATYQIRSIPCRSCQALLPTTWLLDLDVSSGHQSAIGSGPTPLGGEEDRVVDQGAVGGGWICGREPAAGFASVASTSRRATVTARAVASSGRIHTRGGRLAGEDWLLADCRASPWARRR